MTPPPEKTPSPQPPPDEPSPRAFATASGFVFQVIGVILLFGSCCVWSLGRGLFATDATGQTGETWLGAFAGGRLSVAVAAVSLATTLVGGLGLIAAGVGLQNEKRGSGTLALVVTGFLGVIWWTAAILSVFNTRVWGHAIIAGIFAVIATVLFFLAGHSAQVLRRHPPPKDQNVVSDEFLEEIARQKRRRRSED